MATYGGAIQAAQNLAQAAVQTPASMQERRAASEDFLAGLQADIGKPGTYDLPPAAQPPAGGPVQPTPSTPAPASGSGLLSQDGYTFTNKAAKKKYQSIIKRGYSPEEAVGMMPADRVQPGEDSILTRKATGTGGAGYMGGNTDMTTLMVDPEKAKAKVESSSMFRTVSRMQAESEQMLARQGPLWDEMMKNTQLPIIEASATIARENAENIRQAMARGGSARRDAFEAVQKIRAQDQANMQKGQMLAQAHTQMDQWSRQYAQSTVAFAQNWSQNVAGVRESFLSGMDNAAALFENSALPFAFGVEQQTQQWREAASAQSRGKVNRWITGVLGIATGIMTAYQGGDASGSLNLLNQTSGGTTTKAPDGGSIAQGAGSILRQIQGAFSGQPNTGGVGASQGAGDSSTSLYQSGSNNFG